MSKHTPGPKLCPKCGERQPNTQDWFGEAVRQKAVNADLLAALRAVEWVSNHGAGIHVDRCPTCGCRKPDGHAPDCPLAAALRKGETLDA